MRVRFTKTTKCSYGVFPAGREVDLPKSMLDVMPFNCYELLEKSEPETSNKSDYVPEEKIEPEASSKTTKVKKATVFMPRRSEKSQQKETS